MSFAYRTQDETRQQILHIVGASAHPLTRKQIVDALGRAKSPHILNIIEELVDGGLLCKSVVTLPNGVQGYAYSRC